jgi:hypothetical protein
MCTAIEESIDPDCLESKLPPAPNLEIGPRFPSVSAARDWLSFLVTNRYVKIYT